MLTIVFSVCILQARGQAYQCTDAIYFTSSTAGNTNVYRYTPSTNIISQVTGYTIGAPSAGSALSPDGKYLYSVDAASPFNLRFNNGSTNTNAATGVVTSAVQRHGIAPNGIGYFMVGSTGSGAYNTYSANGATTSPGSGTLIAQPSTAPAFVNGGDIAFDAGGIGYLIDQGKNFYRLDFSSNTATFLGTFSGTMDGNPNGIGFTTANTASQNFLYASTLNNKLYRLDLAAMTVNLVTPTTTAAGFTQNDIASCIYPNVNANVAAVKAWRNVTKGDPATFTTSTPASVGDVIEYRVIVRNSGVIAAGNTTFVDAIPSGLIYVANSTTLNAMAVTDNFGSGNAAFAYQTAKNINGASQTAGSSVLSVDSTPAITTDNEATIVFRATVTSPFTGAANPIPNTATVDYAGSSGAVSSNTVTTPVLVPDLEIAKSHTGNFVRGSTGTYTITVSNAGTAATNGTITMTDTLPAGLTVNAGLLGAVTPGGTNAANWTCNSNASSPQVITCASSTAIPASGSSVFTLTVNIGASTASSVSNNVAISGGGEATLNNGNNTASDATTVVSTFSIIGNIFEDANYAGGAGRSLAASGGAGRGGARVELYNSFGIMIDLTTSASSGTVGQYQFTGVVPGNYTVRVVDSTVSSARAGYVSTLVGVQTFRTNAGAADTDRVGGEDPTKIDAGANTLGASLLSLTFGSAIAQSVSPVTIAAANITGVDFGFNFDTIVNTNDSGQGSLRQFVANSNALSGADTGVFMISDGAAHGGLRSGLTNQLTNGVAIITLSNLLPAIVDSLTTIDGTTQTTNVGNTNSGTFGTGGTVGVDNLMLSTVNKPEVQIADGANLAIGLDLQAASETIRGISIYGFGTAANSDTSANIRVGAGGASALIEKNIIGSTATAFADPGSGARSDGDNIRSVGGANGTVQNNIIAFSQGKGFGVENNSTGWTIVNNEIRGNGIGNSNLDGIDLESAGSTGNTVRGNLIYDNEGVGVDSYGSNGSNIVVNNTITNNGIGASPNVETAGVRIYGANNVIDRNKIFGNYGAGVMVTSNASADTITKNSIYANGTILNKSGAAASGQLGIDLLGAADNTSTGASPYVTVNDAGDADTGGNGLLNFPVLENARISNGNLILTGYARPGAAMEFFVAAPDATGFGEGQTYLVTLTEGSAQDTDAGGGTYTSPFSGKTVGTDTTNRFSFSIALPSGVSSGTVLTATATLSGATSEFSNNVTISNAPPAIGLVKAVSPTGTQLPGTDLNYTITFTNTGGQPAINFVLTDPNPADTTLKLNSNTDFKIGSAAAMLPAGLTATVAYSNDNGATFAYTPVSAAGGASAGYDRAVTHIRWTFAGSLSQASPNNTGNVSFSVKIR